MVAAAGGARHCPVNLSSFYGDHVGQVPMTLAVSPFPSNIQQSRFQDRENINYGIVSTMDKSQYFWSGQGMFYRASLGRTSFMSALESATI
jgi:hypothetical protein